MDKLKIVVGAGQYHNNPGWIHLQQTELDIVKKDNWEAFLGSNLIDYILAEHVFEHLTYEEGLVAAKLCYQYLKAGGSVRCAVPDGYFQDETYQNLIKVGGPGPADHPAASHKIVYNYKTLSQVFEFAGFDVQLLEYVDETGRHHAADWDEDKGIIFRSKKYDPRNQSGTIVFPSLIIEGIKKE